jgi:L-lactate utilization protein LutC
MDYGELASAKSIERVVRSVTERGISVEVVENRAAALKRLQAIIPAGSSISIGGSLTLQQIEFENLLTSGQHPWRNLKGEMLAEKDKERQVELRRQLVMADYFLGSVHGIAETGEIVVLSQTGSQLAPFIFTSRNVIWVAGTQKIVPTLEEAMKRAREYVVPKVEERLFKQTGRRGGGKIGKVLIFENEMPYLGRTVRLILVKEILGF